MGGNSRHIYQQVRLSDAEHASLDRLARKMRRTISDIMRAATDPVLLADVCRAVDEEGQTCDADPR